ncbi:MAG: hypothetical protein AB7Q45_21120, partial [Planctomycetaceae bacterium]
AKIQDRRSPSRGEGFFRGAARTTQTRHQSRVHPTGLMMDGHAGISGALASIDNRWPNKAAMVGFDRWRLDQRRSLKRVRFDVRLRRKGARIRTA